jgi:hypothetical protein
MALKDGSPEDYIGSAVRHFDDAVTLQSNGTLENAGHLIGFAAECAIKSRIGDLGNDSLMGHLPDILPAARKRLGSRANYVRMYDLIKKDVLVGWAVDHRYAATGTLSEEKLSEWIGVTKRLMAAAGIKSRRKV